MILNRKFKNNYYSQIVSNSDDIIQLHIYRLLCTVIASKKINKYIVFTPLIDEFQESQIIDSLIGIAAHIRFLKNNNKFRDTETSCGKLYELKHSGETRIILTFKRACDKIMHAEKIEIQKTDSHSLRSVEPNLLLHGQFTKESTWRAELSLVEFAKEAIVHI